MKCWLLVNLVRNSRRMRDRLPDETLDRFVVVPDPVDSRSGDLPVKRVSGFKRFSDKSLQNLPLFLLEGRE